MSAGNRVATVKVNGPNGEVVINESDFLKNLGLYTPVDDRSKALATQAEGAQKETDLGLTPPAGTSHSLPSTPQGGAVDPSTNKSAPDPSTTPAQNPAKPPLPGGK